MHHRFPGFALAFLLLSPALAFAHSPAARPVSVAPHSPQPSAAYQAIDAQWQALDHTPPPAPTMTMGQFQATLNQISAGLESTSPDPVAAHRGPQGQWRASPQK